jgi:hypothetical protein
LDDVGITLAPFARLEGGKGYYSGDGFGYAFEAIDNRQHDFIDAPVLELVHDAEPELCAFIQLDPQTKPFLASLRAARRSRSCRYR